MSDNKTSDSAQKSLVKGAKKAQSHCKSDDKPSREEKLAEALRANLRRRKQASRSRKED